MNPWTPESLLALSRGYTDSRIFLTGAELGLYTLLDGPPKTLDEITSATKTTLRGMAILLDALSAMGLLTKENECYSCPPEVARFLSANAPGSVLPMVNHSLSLWARWAELTRTVREGSVECPAGIFDDPAELEAFIFAMHVVGRNAADAIVARSEADASTNLLDVGGATGTYAEAFLRKHPAMRATVFDRAPVIEMAKRRLADSDVLSRITLAAGDFYTDELPGGHDLALLSAIIHQNSPEQNVDLYKKIYRALVPAGRLLIRDHVMSEDRLKPRGGAMFAVNMLAATSGGNCYTLAEIQETLEEAGFSRVRLVQQGEMMDALVEAFK